MLKRPRSEVTLSAPELTQHLGRAGTSEAILLLVSSHGDKFNDIHVATALHCLARSKPLPPASSLTALCGIAQRALEQKCTGASVGGGSCKARTISALCFSIATLDLLGYEPLSLALSQAVGASLPGSDGASVSSILWCMGKGWKPSEGHLPRATLALKACALARTMSPTEVANAAWGAARSGIIHGPMWASFSQRVLAILIPSPSTSSSSSFRPAAFTPHGLAIVAWSWGYARLQDSPLGEALGRAIMPLLQSRTAFEALELSQLAFAWVRGVFPARIATPLWEVFVGAVATALPTLTPSTSTSLLAAVMAASMAASSSGSGGDVDGTSSSSTPSSPHLLPLAQSLTTLSLSADFSTLGPSELSCICLAIGRGLHRGGSSSSTSSSTSQPTSHQLISRLCPPLCETASVMPWRSVGACDVALRVLLLEEGAREGAGEEERGGGGKQKKKKKGGGSESASSDVAATSAAAFKALGERAVAIAKELEEASDALCAAPGALFISLLHSQHPQLQLVPSSAGGGSSSTSGGGGGGGTSTVLLYGDDPRGAVTRALVAEGGREKGCGVVRVVHWRRMECEGGMGECKVGGEMNVEEEEEEEEGEGRKDVEASSKKRRNKAQPWIDDSLFSTTSSSSSSSSTPSPLCSAAVIRFPSSLDAFSYALAAILPHLSVGAPLYVLGGAGEGLTPAFLSGVEAVAAVTAAAPTTTRTTGGGGSSGKPALKNVTVLASSAASSAASGSIVCRAFKADGKVDASHAFDFEEWVTTPPSPSFVAEAAAGEVATSGDGKKCQQQQQQQQGGCVMVSVSSLLPSPWISLPGLFAGGGLDVMSAHLIDLTRRKGWVSSGSGSGSGSGAMRVLDFCCGNGAIGGALKGINPSLHLTLCDADALAMQACMRNLEGVQQQQGQQHLSGGGGCGSGGGIKFRQRAGLPPIHGSKKKLFHAIFSNPPVHRGQGDSLGVVCELLSGAGDRLVRPGGALHIVAQAHIPVGALAVGLGVAGGGGQGVTVEHHSVEGGRFIVWRLVY